MPIQLPLTVKEWGNEGDEWPDRRISLSSDPYAVMISPRMAEIGVAKKEAQFLADSVNEYADALPLIHDMMDKLKAINEYFNPDDPVVKALIARAEKALENTSFDKLSD